VGALAANPFKPTAGANPPLLVGRDEVIEEFIESIDDGPGAPGRLTIFSGPRGIGKTVMLNAVGNELQASHQWLVINETATPGFLDRIAEAARDLLDTGHRSVTGVTLPGYLGGGGITLAPPEQQHPGGFRKAVGLLLDQCEARQTGLLVTLDEVQVNPELAQLAADTQHLIRDDRQIAMVFAGIPSSVNDLLNDQLTTFLRRANRVDLGDIPIADAAAAIQATLQENGRTISQAALEAAARATGGYPFMIQLVGYHIWRQSTADHITIHAVTAGIEKARKRLGTLVLEAALRELSCGDRAFLAAMAQGPSAGMDVKTSDVATRIGKDVKYASVYRDRLIAAGIITAAGFGQVRFAIPYLREYLVENAAANGRPARELIQAEA